MHRSPEMDSVVSEVKAFNKHGSLKSPGSRHSDVHATATSLQHHPLMRAPRHSSKSSVHQLTDHSSSGSDSPRATVDGHLFTRSPALPQRPSPSVSARRWAAIPPLFVGTFLFALRSSFELGQGCGMS